MCQIYTLEHIQTYPAQPVDIRMVDLGQESDFWRSHRVVIWEEEFELEYTAFIRGLRRAMDCDVEVSEVVFMRDSTNTRHTEVDFVSEKPIVEASGFV